MGGGGGKPRQTVTAGISCSIQHQHQPLKLSVLFDVLPWNRLVTVMDMCEHFTLEN